MRNEFMTAARQAMHRLRSVQTSQERIRAKADARLSGAQERHAAEVGRAELLEASGWMALLAVPGVTVPTAAALMGVSESTVSRWVARYNRGLEESHSAGAGSAP
jgi:hypothetical protein